MPSNHSSTTTHAPSPNTIGDLAALWQRGTQFLGCRYAIMGGAMTWVSERHLVAAISNAGGFGVLAEAGP
jgi:enoyl-[acyl-carrier protein] reductase II